jgi:hypothetical protein
MAHLDLPRLEELENYPVRLKDGEFPILLSMAKKQLLQPPADTARDHSVKTLQVALQTEMENLRQCAVKLADSDRLRKLAAMDLGASEAHCQSLIRRLQDSLAKEKSIREWHDEFRSGVDACIDRKELGLGVAQHVTLLRLQEALDPVVPVAAPTE